MRADGRAGASRGAEPALALAAAAAAWFAWAGLAGLGTTGEEHLIAVALERSGGTAHVFRPLADHTVGWFARLPGEEMARVGFGVQRGLHALNAALLWALMRALGLGRPAALAAALAFAVGAGASDALAWLSAINRPLSSFGALLCFLGLALHTRPGPRGGRARDLALAGAGFAVQFASNEEVYGTALLAAVWIAAASPWRARARWAAAAVAPALVLVHYFALRGGAAAAPVWHGLEHVLVGIGERHREIGSGLGLRAAFAPWAPLLGVALLFAVRERRAAAFGMLALGAALVPFALDPGQAYRDYPSLAPYALLVAGGLVAAAAKLVDGGQGQAERPDTVLAWGAGALVIVWVALGSAAPRAERLAPWRGVGDELLAVEAALAERPGVVPTALFNLDTSTRALLQHRLGLPAMETLPEVCGLDAAAARGPLLRPPGVVAGPWLARRFDGRVGWIDDPDGYLAGRPALEGIQWVGEWETVPDEAAAAARLADPSFDPARAALVEDPEGVLGPPPGPGDGAGDGAANVRLEPSGDLWLDAATLTASRRARIDSDAPGLVVFQEPWTFSELWRFAPDLAAAQRIRERRVLIATARDTTSHEALPAVRAQRFATAVLVPAGTREIEVLWRRATPPELK